MIEFLKVLTLPITLSVIGFILVFLGMAGSVQFRSKRKKTQIILSPARQKVSMVFGGILVLLGIAIFMLPSLAAFLPSLEQNSQESSPIFPSALSVAGGAFFLLGISDKLQIVGVNVKILVNLQKLSTVLGVIFVLLGITVYLPLFFPAPETGGLQGVIIDDLTEERLSGVTVSTNGETFFTGSNGYYRFTALPASGNILVSVEHPGFEAQTKDCWVEANSDKWCTFRLLPLLTPPFASEEPSPETDIREAPLSRVTPSP